MIQLDFLSREFLRIGISALLCIAGTAYTVVVYDGDKSTDTVADRAIELGRRMLDVAKGAVASSGVCLNIRIGMHVGSAHAGFVDGKVPRYLRVLCMPVH